jgi:hypothetical protein
MTNSVKELVIQARNLADAMNSSKEFLITPFLNALAAVESEGDGWIEVKEGCEMPETSETLPLSTIVMGHYDFGGWDMMRYHAKKGWRIVPSGFKATRSPIYWRPLPAPPTQPTEKEE